MSPFGDRFAQSPSQTGHTPLDVSGFPFVIDISRLAFRDFPETLRTNDEGFPLHMEHKLLQIEEAVFQVNEQYFLGGEFPDLPEGEEDLYSLEQLYNNHTCTVYTVLEDEVIIGGIAIKESDSFTNAFQLQRKLVDDYMVNFVLEHEIAH